MYPTLIRKNRTRHPLPAHFNACIHTLLRVTPDWRWQTFSGNWKVCCGKWHESLVFRKMSCVKLDWCLHSAKEFRECQTSLKI